MPQSRAVTVLVSLLCLVSAVLAHSAVAYRIAFAD